MKKTFGLLLLISSFIFLFLSFQSKDKKAVYYNDDILSNKYEYSDDNVKVIEYLREDENVNRWTTLFAIRKYNDDIPAELLINSVTGEIKKIESNKKDSFNQVLNFISDNDKDVHILEFVLSTDEFIEYNLFRYFHLKSGELVNYQLSKRHYLNKSFDTKKIWLDETIATRKHNFYFIQNPSFDAKDKEVIEKVKLKNSPLKSLRTQKEII